MRRGRVRSDAAFYRAFHAIVDILDDAGLKEEAVNLLAERIARLAWKAAGRVHSDETREAIGRGMKKAMACQALPKKEFAKYLVKE